MFFGSKINYNESRLVWSHIFSSFHLMSSNWPRLTNFIQITTIKVPYLVGKISRRLYYWFHLDNDKVFLWFKLITFSGLYCTRKKLKKNAAERVNSSNRDCSKMSSNFFPWLLKTRLIFRSVVILTSCDSKSLPYQMLSSKRSSYKFY